jgi:hypothetical protein
VEEEGDGVIGMVVVVDVAGRQIGDKKMMVLVEAVV